jgi:hypothetical protein
MVGFRNVAAGTALSNWWDNGANQISFCRGDQAFIAFNNEMFDMNQSLQVSLIKFDCIFCFVFIFINKYVSILTPITSIFKKFCYGY